MGKWTDEARRMKPFIQRGIQSLGDADAVEIKTVYPEWRSLIGVTVSQGFKFQHDGKLYEEIASSMLSGVFVVGVYDSRFLYPAGGSFMSDISTYVAVPSTSSNVVFSHNVMYDYGQEIFSFYVNEGGYVEYFAPQVNS